MSPDAFSLAELDWQTVMIWWLLQQFGIILALIICYNVDGKNQDRFADHFRINREESGD